MRAVVVNETGGPHVLHERQVPRPSPGPGEVLVRIEAAGVNFIDTYFRDGTYPAPLPLVPGQEAAGVIVEAGAGALDDAAFAVGDRVAFATVRGAYAESASVPVTALVPVPDTIGARNAAALLLQGLAARYLTHDTHPVRDGEVVVVHAGAGGLGRLLVQLATARGARVLATASTEDKRRFARDAGAHAVCGYEEPDGLRARVDEISEGRGASVVFDGVGAPTFESSLRALGPRGHLVLCGLSGGRVPPFDLDRLRSGSLTVSRPSLADHTRDAATLRASAADLFDHLTRGRVSARVHAELPLADAAEAHQMLQSRRTAGKLLLIP
ncbi:quinone oxidoreductase [Streptomyces griseoflavus]|uniref:quinone oxidoreductase family protein n=1 Tax=Streptomyces griseoflavus TaxID=35619 RepID=UPI00167E7144|nr:quinone oxidoreductase [Streptomyces griseoflavus]GGV46638.1 quinone oxidoreductase [Streptomyces griseoflavus]